MGSLGIYSRLFTNQYFQFYSHSATLKLLLFLLFKLLIIISYSTIFHIMWLSLHGSNGVKGNPILSCVLCPVNFGMARVEEMPGKMCSSSLVQFSTPTKAAKSSDLSEQEYTHYDIPLALLSLLTLMLQCFVSCSLMILHRTFI